jgi:LacI family transcriptional regulator
MSKRRSVALLIETSKSYGRGLLEGISRYVHTHRRWSIFLAERGLDDPLPPWFRRWRGDGIILRSSSAASTIAVRRRRVPTVYLGEVRDTGLPMLHSDERAIARQAAEHLIERGFTSFAYIGLRGLVWSDQRRRYFEERLAESGYQCALCEFDSGDNGHGDWVSRERELSRWLLTLPKPAAVLACYDVMGMRVLDACRGADIAVPEQVAVLGVDDDPLLCALADPPLSSVAHDLKRIGYEAAGLLDAIMAGQSRPTGEVLVEPTGVIGRQSTDILALPDEKVARALRFIREHGCDGIDVDDVVRAVGVHRATLTRRFEKHLGRSPKAEIMRLQLDRVKQLLRETDFTLSRIADLAGFRHAEYMSVIFKRKTGRTPGAYRKQFGRPGE